MQRAPSVENDIICRSTNAQEEEVRRMPRSPDRLLHVRVPRLLVFAVAVWFVFALIAAAITTRQAAARVSPKLVPARGVLLGAMAPNVPRFQRMIKRRLALEHMFYDWTHRFPARHERWTVAHRRIPL